MLDIFEISSISKDVSGFPVDLTVLKVTLFFVYIFGPKTGEYGYARWTVQALERLLDSGDYHADRLPVQFDGREDALEITDVLSVLTNQMDMAFKYVMGLEEYDDDDEDWISAKNLFVNPSGLPYGAVMYGLFMNLRFANVFTMHPSMHHSKHAQIENLKIHDLHHKVCCVQ